MATQNDYIVQEIGNKVIYIEPNFVGGGVDNVPVPLEDLSIYIELRVEYKQVRTESRVTSDSQEIILQYQKLSQNQSYISLYNGTSIGGDVFLSTQGYGNYTLNSITKEGTEELFGIETIDISYNSFSVPEINIKFTDIKGAALHAAEELAHDENGNLYNTASLSCKFLSCFFTVPYPRFKLAVKGFYGKPAYYELTCADLRSSFNSKTGNYDLNVRLVGYSFGLISDINMCSLIVAPNCADVGKEYWEQEIENGRFKIGNTSMPTLTEIIKVWNEKKNITEEDINTLSKNNLNKECYEKIRVCALNILETFEVQWTGYTVYIGTYPVLMGMIEYMSMGKVVSLLKKRFEKDCYEILKSYDNLLTIPFFNVYDMRVITPIEEFDKDFIKEQLLKKGWTGGFNDDFLTQVITFVKEMKYLFNKRNFDAFFIDGRLVLEWCQDMIRNGEVSSFNKFVLKEKILQEHFNNTLGFYPSVENMTKICFAHLETFLYMFEHVRMVQQSNDMVLFPKILENITNFDGVMRFEEVWLEKVFSNRQESKLVKGISEGYKTTMVNSVTNNLYLDENVVSHPADLEEHCYKNLCVDGKINMDLFQERISFLFSEGTTNAYCTKIPEELGQKDAMAFIKYNSVLTSEISSAIRRHKFTLFNEPIQPQTTYQHIIPHNMVCYDASVVTVDNKKVLGADENSNVGFFNLDLSQGWDSNSFNKELFIQPKSGFLMPNNNYINNYSTSGYFLDGHDEDAPTTQQSRILGGGNDSFKPTFKGLDYIHCDYMIFESCVATPWQTFVGTSSLMTIINVDLFTEPNQNYLKYDESKSLFARGTFYSALENRYIKGYLFLLSFRFFKDDKKMTITDVINEILFNGNFNDVTKVSRLIEAIPYFLYLTIGGIFYCHQNNHTDYYKFCDEEIFNIRNDYQKQFINDFKQWVDKRFKRWDSAFSEIREASKAIAVSNNQRIVRKYCLGNIGGYNPTIFIFDPNSAIVKEMTADFFKCVWLVKYGKGIYSNNSHFPNNKISNEQFSRSTHLYVEKFEKTLQEYFEKDIEDEVGEKYSISTSAEFINLNIYRYLKQIWDRWLVNKELGFDRWKLEEVFGRDRKRIHFIDASYNDIGQYIMCDIGKFVELLLVCQEQEDMPFLTFLSYFYRDNNCILNNVQNFLNFQDKNAIENIFKPNVLRDVNLEENIFSDIVVLYSFQPSATIDDGFDINDMDLPSQYRSNRGYKIPAFGVAYGMQNQNYFFDVNVSMNTPNVTDQSIQATLQIAEENSLGGTSDSTIQIRSMSNDMYKVYGNHAYQCTVVMMGCAWIQPLMYFQLLNIPLFRGAYIIHKVTHNISSNNMKTTIVGTKISKIAVKSVETCVNILNRQIIQQENKIYPQNMTQIINDCPYKLYPLWEDEDKQQKNADKNVKKHLETKWSGSTITYAHYYSLLMMACLMPQKYEVDGEKYGIYEDNSDLYKNILNYSNKRMGAMMEYCVCLLYNIWRRHVQPTINDDMDIIFNLEGTIKGMLEEFDLFKNINNYSTMSYIMGLYADGSNRNIANDAAINLVNCFNGAMPITNGYEISDVKELQIQVRIKDPKANDEFINKFLYDETRCMDIKFYKFMLDKNDVSKRVVGKCCFDKGNALMYYTHDDDGTYRIHADPYPMYCFLKDGTELPYPEYEHNYSIDNFVECLNSTLRDSENLKGVSISAITKNDTTKTFLLQINKENDNIKTQVFDMILQTYYDYLLDICWIVTRDGHSGKVWEYIGGTLDTDTPQNNNRRMTRVCLLKDKDNLSWETITSHENLHKDFYTSLIKRYEILKNNENKFYDVQNTFQTQCTNFTQLTNDSTEWKKNVLNFFNTNNQTKDVIIKNCIEVMDDKINEIEATLISNQPQSTTPSTTTASTQTTDISLLEGKRGVKILSTPPNKIKGGPEPLTNYTQHEGDTSYNANWLQQAKTKNQLQQFINEKCPSGDDECVGNLRETFGYNKVQSATAKKSGKCWRYVHTELKDTLKCITQPWIPNSACRAWQVLDWWGFEQIYYGMTKDFIDGFQNGDIIITEGLNVNKTNHFIHGHIQVYYEGKWYSDICHGASANVYASKDGGCDRPCFIYRIKKKDNIT